MDKSNHKNYIEGFDRNWECLIQNKIIPNEKMIFDLFSKKFSSDAELDLNRGRKKLRELGNLCATSCHEIHEILAGEAENDLELKEIVRNIVNLDYDSLKDIFGEIQKRYSDPKIQKNLQDICCYIDKMRQISKKHTNVISKSE